LISFDQFSTAKAKIPHAATSTASSVPASIYTDQIVRNESELLTTVQHLPVVSVPYATKDSDTGSVLVHNPLQNGIFTTSKGRMELQEDAVEGEEQEIK
jgi:hypothetical protein